MRGNCLRASLFSYVSVSAVDARGETQQIRYRTLASFTDGPEGRCAVQSQVERVDIFVNDWPTGGCLIVSVLSLFFFPWKNQN